MLLAIYRWGDIFWHAVYLCTYVLSLSEIKKSGTRYKTFNQHGNQILDLRAVQFVVYWHGMESHTMKNFLGNHVCGLDKCNRALSCIEQFVFVITIKVMIIIIIQTFVRHTLSAVTTGTEFEVATLARQEDQLARWILTKVNFQLVLGSINGWGESLMSRGNLLHVAWVKQLILYQIQQRTVDSQQMVALLEWYFKITTIHLPPSCQNFTGSQSVGELISKWLNST